MKTELIRTKDLSNRFFYNYVDLQKPMAELQETLVSKNVDVDNVIKGGIVLDFVKHMDEFYDGLVSDYRPEETFDDHSSLVGFNLLIEDTLSLSEILKDFTKWVSGKYPYSRKLAILIFELIKEVYDYSNEFFEGKIGNDYLKYIVTHSSLEGDKPVVIKIEEVIHFL